jgi:hypothetical protein
MEGRGFFYLRKATRQQGNEAMRKIPPPWQMYGGGCRSLGVCGRRESVGEELYHIEDTEGFISSLFLSMEMLGCLGSRGEKVTPAHEPSPHRSHERFCAYVAYQLVW